MVITKSDIARVIGNTAYFTRGLSCFNKRKVISVAHSEDGVITGTVMGSAGTSYHSRITASADRTGRLSRISGECTCPVGYNCEHVVAVLLEVAWKRQEATLPAFTRAGDDPSVPAVMQARLPAPVSSWLDSLSDASGALPVPTENTPSRKTSTNAIFYVFRLNRDGRAEIVPYQGYVKKDGNLGKSVRELNTRHHWSSAQEGVTHYDAIILAQLEYFSESPYSKVRNWPTGDALKLFLQQVVATGRALADDIRGPKLTWANAAKIIFDWQIDASGDQRLQARGDAGQDLTLLAFPDPVFIDRAAGRIGFAQSDLPPGMMTTLTTAPPVPAETVASVSAVLKKHLGAALPCPKPLPFEEHTDIVPAMRLRLFGHERKEPRYASAWYIRTNPDIETVVYPCIQSDVRYDGCDASLVAGVGPDIRQVGKDGLKIIRRNMDMERTFVAQLESIANDFDGFPPDYADVTGTLPKAMRTAEIIFPAVLPSQIPSGSDVLAFTAEGVPQLRDLGWDIEVDPSWPVRLHAGDVRFQTVIEPSENDWFSLGVTLDVDGTQLDLTQTILQVLDGLPLDAFGVLPEGFVLEDFLNEVIFYQQLPDGALVPIPGPRLTGLVEAFLEAQGVTRFHKADSARATALAEALEGCGAPWEGGAEIRALGKRLQTLSMAKTTDPPASLKAQLRPYQQQGYGWLKALNESGFGGILADDMGLGKTVQALSLLTYCHLECQTDRASLLVMPTSLISNWQNEAERFAPDLKVLCLHGPDRRTRFDQINAHDLVLTTYPLINRDHKELFSHKFELAILDEAQAVKNPAAAVAKHIRHIDARQRLALTGTPLENNLMELWSLFDWLIPGFLGNRKGFGSEYRRPIEHKGDRAQQRLLSSRVKPFLLRRTKDEVVKDLPAKTIIDDVVTLAGKQAMLYESVRSAMDDRVREAIQQKGLSGSRITVLDALLKLRQVCCDPQLVKLEAATKVEDSAKRDRLKEILEELMSENRKVLVFSQFVEMLRLIEKDVQDAGWHYAMLHGQTRDRKAEIDKFQSGDAQLFLISLKAGGTGLNLTAADTVILYDPWWNPAVERQAMDRAHRIGQDKPVFVYRLYTENTVETAIQAMQAQKQALADALFEGGGAGALTLTEDDLTTLFGTAQTPSEPLAAEQNRGPQRTQPQGTDGGRAPSHA